MTGEAKAASGREGHTREVLITSEMAGRLGIGYWGLALWNLAFNGASQCCCGALGDKLACTLHTSSNAVNGAARCKPSPVRKLTDRAARAGARRLLLLKAIKQRKTD